jgi:beta-lactamase superfamily II metal-dependent hydrolase
MMMDSPELLILDVGHGNCALLRDTDGIIVIDCARGATLKDALNQYGITEITHILISHADADHVAGIVTLLTEKSIKVKNIYLNPDALKNTDIWRDLRVAIKDARRRGAVTTHIELTSTLSGTINVGQVNIAILAPSPELAMAGVGGNDLEGKTLTSNSMSAVICLEHDGHRLAIMTGDIDEVGLHNLQRDHGNIPADVLVFPHHGGSPGQGNAKTFAESLCNLVQPSLVIFSMDRDRFSNPKEDIVQGIMTAIPNVHILCTELSKQCAAAVPLTSYDHLSKLPAKGVSGRKNNCCGGSVIIRMRGNKSTYEPLLEAHRLFISKQVSTPLCRRFIRS